MTDARGVPVVTEEQVLEIVRRHEESRGPLLPILRDLQATFGYIDPEALPVVASALNLSRAEVHGVVSFYADFRTEPPGAQVVQICRAEACQSMGADALVAHACARLGVDLGETTPDGAVTLRSVFCLGNCGLSPAVMIDGELVGRVDPARFDELVAPRAASVR